MDTSKHAEPQARITPIAVAWYSLANLGYGAFYAFNNYILPLWLKHYTANAIILGLMGSTHSFEGAFIQPVVGSISDRSRSPWGRRRPFMLLSIFLSAVFLLAAPLAVHLSPGTRLGAIILCIFLFTVAFNVALVPYQALLSDITPFAQRGRVTGFWYLVGALGQVGILFLNLSATLKFTAVALLMLGTTFLTCLTTREPNTSALPLGENRFQHELALALSGLKTLRQARIYMIVFFCYGAGVGVVVPYLTIFIQSITHCSDHAAELMPMILMLATALGSWPFGWVCDRIGPKPLLLFSMALIAGAAVNGLWVTSLPQIGMVLAFAGLGMAAQNASAYPLLTRIVPHAEIGFYVGLQASAVCVSVPAAVFLTGFLVNHSHHNYRVIFALCAACLLLALLVLLPLREWRAQGEIAVRDRQQGRGPETDLNVAIPTILGA